MTDRQGLILLVIGAVAVAAWWQAYSLRQGLQTAGIYSPPKEFTI